MNLWKITFNYSAGTTGGKNYDAIPELKTMYAATDGDSVEDARDALRKQHGQHWPGASLVHLESATFLGRVVIHNRP